MKVFDLMALIKAAKFFLEEGNALYTGHRLYLVKQKELTDELQVALKYHSDNGPKSISDGYHTFDDLYSYRLRYNAMLFQAWAKSGQVQVVRSKYHSDGTKCYDGSHFIVIAYLPTGQISNHYSLEHWWLFDSIPTEHIPKVPYDGHTPELVEDRMLAYIAAMNADSADEKQRIIVEYNLREQRNAGTSNV